MTKTEILQILHSDVPKHYSMLGIETIKKTPIRCSVSDEIL